MDIRPFRISASDAELADLHERLRRTRWPDAIPGSGWAYGTDLEYLKDLCGYWLSSFDWRDAERRLNEFPQYTTEIDGQQLHFIHARSPRDDARPLLLLHGWPGSVVEFMHVMGPLTDPESHGGAAGDAFHVVAPSLPGFGWSGPTREAGWHPGRISDAFAALMTELGYDRFYCQGGDYGSLISSQLALRLPERVRAIHITFVLAPPVGPGDPGVTPEELALMSEQELYNLTETAYVALQSTKPQSIAYSLVDSPVALAAWITEKFHAWTDNDGRIESAVSRDDLLANITAYWLTATGGSSGRLYFETAAAGFMGPSTRRVEVPVAVAVFPRELYRVSRRMAEGQYNVVRWSEQPKGGHFAALEVPGLLVEDIRTAFRGM
jgi:microsomal epoxide hydrolase